jgi:Cof subfamily protein (haloacid dehalogenase superfamily)
MQAGPRSGQAMPPPAVRVVATDIDGTVFNSHHEVPAANAAAMRAAAAAGCHVVVCTGKVAGPWSDSMLSALKLNSFSVYNNGGLILDREGEIVYEALLPREVVVDVLAALAELRGETSQVAVSCAGLDYRNALFVREHNHVSDFIASAGENPPEIVGDLHTFIESNDLSVNKLFLATDQADGGGPDFSAMQDVITAAVRGRAEILPDPVAWFSPTTGTIEIMPLGQSKAQGMAFVLEQLGETADAMLAIGDGTNDIEMLQMARAAGGVSVAMGNANPAVKAAAEFETASNDEGGMGAALRKFVLQTGSSGTVAAAPASGESTSASSWSDDTATVPVPGLREPLRVLHLGDSHINVDLDHHYQQDGEQLRNGELIGPAIQTAADSGAKLVVHTGDLVHGVSEETVDHLSRELLGADAVLPFMYISGNADWMHESTPSEISFEDKEAIRASWRETNAELYNGAEPSVWTRDVVEGELRFIGVDNSTGQVSQAQLEQIAAAVEDGIPWVLMLHIPLCLPAILAAVPGAGSLCGNPDDTALPASDSTMNFLSFVRSSPSVVAVLAGHIHQPQAQLLRDGGGAAVQLVTAAAKDG